MRPVKGKTDLILPITFDYSGGRKDSQKTAKIWAIIICIVGVIVGVGTMFSKKGNFFMNLLLGVGILYLVAFIVRFFILHEGKIRSQEIEIQDSDFKRDYKDFWGIYAIDSSYPHFCRFRNGRSGVFVRLNRDVILGKYSDAEFEHDEAIGDAYNLCGSSDLTMCHIDYMDNIGTDERLEESFINLSKVENPDIKDLLTDVFSYQQSQMLERVTTFDTYLFSWVGSDINAWSSIQRVLSCFMQANYRSYHILNEDDLRELVIAIENLEEFSTVEAMLGAFSTEVNRGIKPIKLINVDGTETILGKTREQIAEEQALKEKQQELKKQEVQRRKHNKKKTVNEDEEIDIF